MGRTTTVHRYWNQCKEIWPLLPAALYLLSFLFVVLFYLVGLSFSSPATEGLAFPTVRTIAKVVQMPQFRVALLNTTVFVMIGTPLELLVGIVLGLILYRHFLGRDFVRGILVLPLAIPALVTAILLFILFDYPGGHVNHLLMGKYPIFPGILSEPINWRGSELFALGVSMIGKLWRDMPISMLIILAGLLSIDPELFDAAKSMGAGWRQQFRHVVLPLIVPSISAVLLLRSIEMWKEFIFPFVLAGQTDLLGTFIESLYNDWGYANEAAVVAMILVGCIIVTTFILLGVTDLLRRFVYEGGNRG